MLKNWNRKGILLTIKEPKQTEQKEPDTLWHCVLPDYLDLSERIGRIIRGALIGIADKPLRTI